MSLKIERLYAFVAIDPKDGNEGIMAFKPQNSDMMLPMIGADMTRMQSLISIADEVAELAGVEYILKYYKLEESNESILN